MAVAHLYLTDGFANDRVVVHVDGKQIFDGGVTTNRRIGLAKTIGAVPVTGSNMKLDITLPDKGIHQATTVDLSRGSHVPISVEGGRVTHSVTKNIGFG